MSEPVDAPTTGADTKASDPVVGLRLSETAVKQLRDLAQSLGYLSQLDGFTRH